MTEHQTFIIDGKEYRSGNYHQGTPYIIYRVLANGPWEIGHVWGLRPARDMGLSLSFVIKGWGSVGFVGNDATSLGDAVIALVLELDRRAASRKEPRVSWGE